MNMPLLILGLYMLAMAVTGFVRTGSPTALYIMGGLGAVSTLMSYLVTRGTVSFWVAFGWVALIAMVVGIMTFKRIAAHANARPGSALIFGSTAAVAFIVLIMLWNSRPAQ